MYTIDGGIIRFCEQRVHSIYDLKDFNSRLFNKKQKKFNDYLLFMFQNDNI